MPQAMTLITASSGPGRGSSISSIDSVHDRRVPDEALRTMVGHVGHRLHRRRRPAAALPAEEEGDPHGSFEKALLNHPHGIPHTAIMERFDFHLGADAAGQLAIFL